MMRLNAIMFGLCFLFFSLFVLAEGDTPAPLTPPTSLNGVFTGSNGAVRLTWDYVNGAGFYDEFTTGAPGWSPISGVWTVGNDVYRVDRSVLRSASAAHDNLLSSFSYEVRARKVSGNPYNYGLYFNGVADSVGAMDDWVSGYWFCISASGDYKLVKFINGVYTVLQDWTTHSAINQGLGAWNTLKVNYSDGNIELFINNIQAGTYYDITYRAGQIGLKMFDNTSSGYAEFDYASLTGLKADVSFHELTQPTVRPLYRQSDRINVPDINGQAEGYETALRPAEGWRFSNKNTDTAIFKYFKIYRNDIFYDTTTQKYFDDRLPSYGSYRYKVSALYAEGESTPTGPILLTWQPMPFITVTPDSFHIILKTGDSLDRPMTIGNTGQRELNWSISSSGVKQMNLPALDNIGTTYKTDGMLKKVSSSLPEASMPLMDLTGKKIAFLSNNGVLQISSDLQSRGALVTLLSMPLTSSSLNGVNVVAIGDEISSASSSDRGHIRDYVLSGGGLISYGDDSYSAINSILSGSGITLMSRYSAGYDLIFTKLLSHPVAIGIDTLYGSGVFGVLTLQGQAKAVVLEDDNSVHCAASTMGQGRVFVIANEMFEDGLLYTYDIRRFTNQIFDWVINGSNNLRVIPDSGTVQPSGSQQVSVRFTARELQPGVYNQAVYIISNDTLNSPKQIKAWLGVTQPNPPSITVNPNSITATIGYRDSLTIPLSIGNTGIGSLNWKLTSFSPWLLPSSMSDSAAPGSLNTINIVLKPGNLGLGTYTDSLIILSNDVLHNPIIIPVKMIVNQTFPPAIYVSPGSFSLSLAGGDSATAAFTIGNNGTGQLNWTTRDQTSKSLYNLPAVHLQERDIILDGRPRCLSGTVPAVTAPLQDLSGKSIAMLGLSGSSVIINDLQLRGALITAIGLPLTDNSLSNFSVLAFGDDIVYCTQSDIEIIRTFIQSGGSILFCGDDPNAKINAILEGTGIDIQPRTGPSIDIITDIETHPTTVDVDTLFSVGILGYLNTAIPAQAIVKEYEKMIHCAASTLGAGRVFVIANELFNDSYMGYNDNRRFANQVYDWLVGCKQFWTITPEYGTVPPGSSMHVDVKFIAPVIQPATLASSFNVYSNDLANKLVTVPMTLQVTQPDLPIIKLIPDSLTAVLAANDSTTGTLSVKNEGTGPLIWEAHLANQSVTEIPAHLKYQGRQAAPAPENEPVLSGKYSAVNGNQISSDRVSGALLSDDFESGTLQSFWQKYSNHSINLLPGSGANGTQYSLIQLRTATWDGHFDGVRGSFTPSQVQNVSFWIKIATRLPASGSGAGYFVLGDANTGSSNSGAIFFMANGNGRFELYPADTSFPYNVNTWYHVEFNNFDWDLHTFDYVINGALIRSGVPFRVPLSVVSSVSLYNFTSGSIADWDEISIDSQPAASWFSYSPAGGTLAPGARQDISVRFNSAGKLPGIWRKSLSFTSNDYAHTPKLAPVKLIVLQQNPPAANVSPNALNLTAAIGDSISSYISLRNTGTGNLTWSLQVMAGAEDFSKIKDDIMERHRKNILPPCEPLYGLGPAGPNRFGMKAGQAPIDADGSASLLMDISPWRNLAPMMFPRSVFGAATGPDGKIYSVAGYGNSGSISSSEYYSPWANCWTSIASLPTADYGTAAAFDAAGNLYVFGSTQTISFKYSPLSGNWTQINPSPSGHHFGSAAVRGNDGKIYLIGGEGTSGSEDPLNLVLIYNPTTDQWSTGSPMPTARYGHAAVNFGGLIYVFGGRSSFEGEPLSKVEVYDPASNTWSAAAPMPDSRLLHSACVVSAKEIYLIGGQKNYYINAFPFLNTIDIYSPASNLWRAGTMLPKGITQCGSSYLDGSLLVIGGRDSVSIRNAAMCLDINKWLSAFQFTGVIAPGASQTVKVKINTAGLEEGIYHGGFVIQSDDFTSPVITIPVTLQVKQPHAIFWQMPILVKDNSGTCQNVVIGLAPSATNGIDTSLGELSLPPSPPAGVFDARLELPISPADYSLKDYRGDSLETSWTIKFQPGTGYPISFTWNPQALPDGSFFLKDNINGSLINIDMKAQSTFQLTNTGITSLSVEFRRQTTKDLQLNAGWNLVSIPLRADTMNVHALFPQATSPAYGFTFNYVFAYNLQEGKGYWIRYAQQTARTVRGTQPANSIPLKAGWNLIGPYNYDIPVSSTGTTPPGIITSSFYEYTGSYTAASTLVSGRGYWVKTNAEGKLNLGIAPKAGESLIPVTGKDWGKIIVADAAGNCGSLFIIPKQQEAPPAGKLELPPLPPEGVFDLRFSSQQYAEALGNDPKEIMISSAVFPIEIRAENIDLIIRDKATGGRKLSAALRRGSSLGITEPGLTSLEVLTRDLPAVYELAQNYPNPFNPTTAIRFGLPEPSFTEVTVYNHLGEKIAVLINGNLEAGYHTVDWNAGNYASGVYFVQLRTPRYTAVKKMLLIK